MLKNENDTLKNGTVNSKKETNGRVKVGQESKWAKS